MVCSLARYLPIFVVVLGFFIAFETIGLCHESLAFTVPLFDPVNMKVQLMLEIMLILFFVGGNGKGCR